MNWVIGAFLVAHGLIHASYLSPAPRTAGGPEWPFELTRSWLVTGLGLDPGIVRAVGTAAVVVTIVLLVAAGLATIGWIVPGAWWPALVAGGAGSSLATLILFFHPWIVLGLAIDLGLIWAVAISGWNPLAATG